MVDKNVYNSIKSYKKSVDNMYNYYDEIVSKNLKIVGDVLESDAFVKRFSDHDVYDDFEQEVLRCLSAIIDNSTYSENNNPYGDTLKRYKEILNELNKD